MIALIVLGLLILAFLGAPLFAIILAASMVGFYTMEVDLVVVAVELFRLADTPLLLALPLFTFAGYLLSESQTSQRLIRLTQAFLGWLPGGMAMVAFVACALFTAFTGASGVTIVALGALLYPALKQSGYSEKFSLGLVTTSGSLGLLLPPSLPLILYGILVQQMGLGEPFTLKELFLAGLLPALLMLVMLSLWSFQSTRSQTIPVVPFSLKNVRGALWEAKWEIPLPLCVLGGIYGGFFAVSEAAAITVMYVLVVEVLIYREIKMRMLARIMRESMVMVGGILLILGVAMAFTNFLIDAEVPGQLFEVIQEHVHDKLTFLILLNILLLVLGALLDIFAALVIMVPLILPVALQYDVHPIHLGIIFLANMQIGYFTPPVGMNLFIASYRFNKSVVTLYKATIPFMLVLLVALLLITYVPELSLFWLSR